MTPGLITRLQDVPGVEAVAVDLSSEAGGINLRLAPDADERKVLQEVHELLVAYGVRGLIRPRVTMGTPVVDRPDIEVVISKLESGARIQVTAGEVQSSRQVAANPVAIAQGLADAWSQVLGRIPKEVVAVEVSGMGGLTVLVSDGETERRGVASIDEGWTTALKAAVGRAMGFLDDLPAKRDDLAQAAW